MSLLMIADIQSPPTKPSDRSISTADIELANKINILKESGLI